MIGAYFRAFWRVFFSLPTFLALAIMSVLFAVSGPFGTYDTLSLPLRFALWFALVAVSLILGIGLRVALQRFQPKLADIPAAITSSFLLATMMAVIVPPVACWLVGESGMMVPGALEVGIMVILLGTGVTMLRYLLTARPEAHSTDMSGRPRLMARLPGDIAGDILHLSVDDHYVDVATVKGNARLLMRFSDAIDEAAGIDGLRVHRSHWVARLAIERVERKAGRTFVILTNGTKVPVSRAYQDAVEDLPTD